MEAAKTLIKTTGRAVICVAAAWTCSGRANPNLDSFTGRFQEVIAVNDRPESLLAGSPVIRNILELEKRQPSHAGAVSPAPWSESFWPMHKGLIANRYLDRKFDFMAHSWSDMFNYVVKNPAAQIVSGGDEGQVDMLSPAEKYDLLVGDPNFGLTNAMWGIGRADLAKHGSVDQWMGLCDGWAMASIMTPEPLHAISVMAQDGHTKLHFYPSDIKALSTLLWSYGDFPVKLIGDRCKQNNPQSVAGRIIDPACRDTNAGTWHLAVVNSIGLQNRGLVADMDGQYEVWNFPLVSYSFSYMNPATHATARTLDQAKMALSAFSGDKFKAYRSPQARYVVGVAMRVLYAVETQPSRSNGPATRTRDSTLIYDLELDESMNIIGGEWSTLTRPDFLWTSMPGAKATSRGDALVPFPFAWNGTKALPPQITQAAQQASANNQPLAPVVERLTELSRSSTAQ